MRILYLLFVLIPWRLLAQPTGPTVNGWQQLTISDGLSQGMIYDFKQDQKGFIWVATKDGLNRYDGHNFTVFTHDPYNDYSLSDNNCSALLIDSRGWLWVGTLNQGLDLFNTRTQRFYHIDIRDQASPNSGNYAIGRLNEDPEGNIWVKTNYEKLFKITIPNALKTKFPDRSNLTSQVKIVLTSITKKATSGIRHVSFSPDGQALAVCLDGTYYFDWHHPQQGGKFSPFPKSVVNFAPIYGNANQDFWLGTMVGKIAAYQHGLLKIIPILSNDLTLHVIDSATIAVTADKYLWLMSPAELMRQDSLTARNAFTTLVSPMHGITTVRKDRTDNIWIGTNGYGLRKFNPGVRQFHSSLTDLSISYVYADQQGRIYVRQQFAYDQFDPNTNRTQPFLRNDLPEPDRRQRYLMQDRQGTFWVSNANFETQEMSLFKFSSDWQLLKKYPLPINTAFGVYRNYTVEDQSGRLWIGATNGKILCFEPQTETFRVFSYQSLLPLNGADIETNFLYFDQAGTLWITTQQGLIRADHLQGVPTFSIYKNSRTNRQSLSNDFVLSLLDDPNEPNRYLWVGTKGSGLDRLDKQTGQFEHITEAQGLPNKVVYGILADEYNHLWLSTNRGLAQFNPKNRTFQNYTKADGLQDDEFNTVCYVKTPSGELLFGGVNGLTTFRASDVVGRTGRKPVVNIIGLKVNNEAIAVGGSDGILTEGIEYSSRIDLSHIQNLLTLEFAVMDYTNSAKNRYRYRLGGIDETWVEAGTTRFANYAQLPAGRYTFQVSGSADGRLWSDPVTLQIRVHPPFYQTWWAYLIYALLAAVIGWQLYRFQKQRWLLQQQVSLEHQEASRLAELDNLKTQFFTNISHEFRTPLTLILGPVDQMAQDYAQDSRFPALQRNANRLLSLINQLLDLTKLEAGQLKPDPERGDMADFFRTLASSFSSLAESRGISFAFNQEQRTFLADFDRDKIEKIITNLLSNAFKFTSTDKEVRMTVQFPEPGSPAMLTIIIADTGIGIAPQNLAHIFERFYQGAVRTVDGQTNRPYEGTGIGLALVNELVNVLGGTINVASTEGVGTTFTVALPVALVEPSALPATVNSPSVTAVSAIAPLQMESSTIDSPTRPHQRPVATQAGGSATEPAISVGGDGAFLLIIDDNADIRAYVRSIFAADYQILEAEDGQEGLEKATASLPDIVICDLMMPRLDGFGFCRALKTQEATSHIPVVMLTAKATVKDRIEGFELGADDYLTKPFNRAEIQARVRNLVQQRQRLYQRFVTGKTESTPFSTEPLKPTEPALLQAEQQFLDRLSAVVNEHLGDTGFGVEALADAMGLGRVQLYRKLKALTNTTAVDFIRKVRLAKAAELLIEGNDSVTHIAYTVGFENLSYFAKVFQERYGVLPSQYTRPGRHPLASPE